MQNRCYIAAPSSNKIETVVHSLMHYNFYSFDYDPSFALLLQTITYFNTGCCIHALRVAIKSLQADKNRQH